MRFPLHGAVFFVRRAILACLLLLPASQVSADEISANEAKLQAEARGVFKQQVTPFIRKYCTGCHGSRPEAGINLDSALQDPSATSSFLHFQKAVSSVKVHDMPPEHADKQPSDEERQQFLEAIRCLKYMAPRDPGPFVIRRLSKIEYGRTLHVLYGVDESITAGLPDEVPGEGYLNSISPMQSELYLEIANRVVNQVLPPECRKQTRRPLPVLGRAPGRRDDPRAMARGVARNLARGAYRRPATDAEIDVLVGIFDLGRQNGLSYTEALILMWKGILVSPQFLFITPATSLSSTGPIAPLDDYQLASRLSYLLWSEPPDAILSGLADRGQLQKPEVLRAQVQRLLSDTRLSALFDGFGAQWLGLSGLKDQVFDPQVYPQMTPTLRQAMLDEARLFFLSVVQENQTVFQFVDSDYTFVNQSLAEIYGLSQPVSGSAMRRVKLQDPNRGGVLGMPAVLASTSFSTRTSPVRRGVWVLEQILGERVPPPPPDVPQLQAQDQTSRKDLTLRELTQLHQSQASCTNCHKVLDPIGFGLENFDGIGRWRQTDASGMVIDSAGVLPTGHSFSNPAQLKRVLSSRRDDIARNVIERLTAYAVGRPLEGYDELVIDRLMEKIGKDGYRMRTMITEIVCSDLFTHRRVQQ